MKLHFPHGEHEDVNLQDKDIVIGSEDSADIKLEAPGIAAKHAVISNKNGQYHVVVDNESRLVSVNGKLVKESRDLRGDDLIIMSQIHIKMVEQSAAQKDDANQTRIRMALPKYILRGVSGTYFGKTYPLRGTTTIGRHSECDICVNSDGISRKHAQISEHPDGLIVKDLESSNGTYVNGEKVNEQVLKFGDEIRLDNIRFLVQSPGMAEESPEKPGKVKPKKKDSNVTTDIDLPSSGGGMKWVITILVVLAAGAGAAWYLGYLDQFLK